MPHHTDFLARRDFIRKGAFAGLGAGLLPFARAMNADAAQNRVRRYVTLGKTDIKMSDISFGSSRLGSDEEDLVLHALDSGINYFDTAESYSWGNRRPPSAARSRANATRSTSPPKHMRDQATKKSP